MTTRIPTPPPTTELAARLRKATATVHRTECQRRLDLRNAVSGVALTERDQRLLDWLAGWDQDTTTALADLIVRARVAMQGPIHTA